MFTQPEIIHFSKKIVQCEECGTKKLCFANALSKQQKEIFSTFVRNIHSYSKNQHLFRIGESADKLFILRSGSAKSYLVTENGNEQIICFHFSGEVFGLDDLAHQHHSSSILFLENASVCMIAKHSFENLLKKFPPLQQETISRLNREITHSHEMLLSANHSSAEQRIASFILELSERMDLIGLSKASYKLSMSRLDIANYLGLATDTISRVLKTVERKGLIRVKNKNLEIIDFQELKNCANACDKCSSVLLETVLLDKIE